MRPVYTVSVLLFSGLLLVIGAAPLSSAQSTTLGTGAFTLVAPPVYATCSSNPCVQANYMNNLGATEPAITYLVVHNSADQTVYYSTATLSPSAGTNATSFIIVFGLAAGTYNATVFATTFGGVGLSTASTVVFSIS